MLFVRGERRILAPQSHRRTYIVTTTTTPTPTNTNLLHSAAARVVDDRPFIVLTETKTSNRHIPVWARYSPLRTRVEAHAITLSP